MAAPHIDIPALLAGVPRIAALIRRNSSDYLGICIVQAPGAWARLGATWATERGWVVIGPGISSWETTQGLAELAVSTAPRPTWHAVGVAVAPVPNLAFACLTEVVAHLGLATADACAAGNGYGGRGNGHSSGGPVLEGAP